MSCNLLPVAYRPFMYIRNSNGSRIETLGLSQ